MPRVLEPPLPPSVEAFVELTGANRVRMAVITVLASSPGHQITVDELQGRTQCNSHVLRSHLRALEDMGLVAANQSREHRGGRTKTIWTIDLEPIVRLLGDCYQLLERDL